MHILTQNFRHGGGSRFEQLIRTCIKENPDVIVLTERRNNKQKNYESMKIRYNQYVIPNTLAKKNSVCILTKEKANIKHIYQHNILAIEYSGLSIWGVYFPQKHEKKAVFDYIEKNIDMKNSIVLGDFNTGKHFIDENGKTFYCTREFTKLSEEKLCDTRRTRNKDSQEYSRYSHVGNGFRIDHILVTDEIDNLINDVGYNHSIRESGLSDHSMMYVHLEKQEKEV